MSALKSRASTGSSVVRPPVAEGKEKDEERLYLVLTRREQRHVSWSEETVDNEFMGKKKSKKCCIYRKPRQWDESSSDESNSSDFDSDEEVSTSSGDIPPFRVTESADSNAIGLLTKMTTDQKDKSKKKKKIKKKRKRKRKSDDSHRHHHHDCAHEHGHEHERGHVHSSKSIPHSYFHSHHHHDHYRRREKVKVTDKHEIDGESETCSMDAVDKEMKEVKSLARESADTPTSEKSNSTLMSDDVIIKDEI